MPETRIWTVSLRVLIIILAVGALSGMIGVKKVYAGMLYPSVDGSPPNRSNHVGYPLWAHTINDVTPTFSWDYYEGACAGHPAHGPEDPSGYGQYNAYVDVFSCPDNNYGYNTDQCSATLPPGCSQVLHCGTSSGSPIFNLPFSTCYPVAGANPSNFDFQNNSLKSQTSYWWDVVPGWDNGNVMVHTPPGATWFNTGVSCQNTTTTLYLGSYNGPGSCNSTNTTADMSITQDTVDRICLRPVNSASQNLNLTNTTTSQSIGTVSSGTGIEYNITSLPVGTNVIKADWPGNAQYCPSSDTRKINIAACTNPTVTAGVSPSGTSGTYQHFYNVVNQQSMYIMGTTNPVSALQSLTYSTVPATAPPGTGIQSVVNPVSGTGYSLNIANWPLGTYYVAAGAGGTGGYCPATDKASFECVGDLPTVFNEPPIGGGGAPPVFNALPTTCSVGLTCGVNECGGYSGDSTDSITCNYYSSSDCTTGLVATSTQTGVCREGQISITNTFSGWSQGTYYVKATEKDKAGTNSSTCDPFVYTPAAPPWWQIQDGHVYAPGNLVDAIPSECTGNTCYMNLQRTPGVNGFPGLAIFGDQAPNGTLGVSPATGISTTGWYANAVSGAHQPSYDDFYRQLPVATTTFTNSTDIASAISNATWPPTQGDAIYLEYSGNSNLTVPALTVGDRKVVIFVPGSGGTVTVGGNISASVGAGFVAIVTQELVTIDPSVTNLANVLIYTMSNLAVPSVVSGNDSQLTVRGMVFAWQGVSLMRDLDKGRLQNPPAGNQANNQTPAEKFVFAPDMVFTFPRALKRVQYSLNEIQPTAQ